MREINVFNVGQTGERGSSAGARVAWKTMAWRGEWRGGKPFLRGTCLLHKAQKRVYELCRTKLYFEEFGGRNEHVFSRPGTKIVQHSRMNA